MTTVRLTSSPPAAMHAGAAALSSGQALSTWKLFAPFTLATVIGAVAILEGAGIWVPCAAIAGFSLLLYLVVLRSGAAWEGSAADSPYFLGFLLTLVAVYHALTLSGEGGAEPGILLRSAGAALLPTGVGLFARQVFTALQDVGARGAENTHEHLLAEIREELVTLIGITKQSLDRDEAALQQTFDRISEELGKIRGDTIIGEVREAHREIVQLTKEMLQHHREYMRTETEAGAQWHRALAETTAELGRLQEAASSGTQHVTDTAGELDGQMREASRPFTAAFQRLDRQSQKLEALLDSRIQTLTTSMAKFEEAFASQQTQGLAAAHAAMELSKHSANAIRDLAAAKTALTGIVEATADVPRRLTVTADAIGEAGKHLEHAVHQTVSPLHREAKEIDSIIGDLTNILTKRVADLRKVK